MKKGSAHAAWKLSAAAAAMLAAACPATAWADWRDGIGTFRIGIVAEPDAGNTVPGLAQITDAYAAALGMKVEIFVARDYAALIDAQASGRIEYAVYSSTAYAAASLKCGCVEPLASPVDADGAAGIRSVLVTRDGKVSALKAIDTHRIAMAPADSVAGAMLPLAGLASAGVKLAWESPALVHAVSASAAEAMLVSGGADAVFGWAPATPGGHDEIAGGTLARLEAAGLASSSLSVVWKSAFLRYGPHAVRSDLDPEAKRRLASFLTGLKATSPDVYDLLESKHSRGFVNASAADYEPALAMVRFATGTATPVSSPSR